MSRCHCLFAERFFFDDDRFLDDVGVGVLFCRIGFHYYFLGRLCRLFFHDNLFRNDGAVLFLFGKGRRERLCIWILRICLIASVFYGSLNKASLVWSLGDIGVGAMAWINIVSILLLSRIAFRALRSYERQKKEKKEPVFNPDELNIKNATFWQNKS